MWRQIEAAVARARRRDGLEPEAGDDCREDVAAWARRGGDYAGPAVWYVVACDGAKELACERRLQHCGVFAWCPVETVPAQVSRHARRRGREIVRALLSGYLFVGFRWLPNAVDWQTVLGQRLVRGVVGTAGVPVAVPQKQIAFQVRRAGLGQFIARRPIEQGDRVGIVRYDWAGHFGVVERVTSRRARVTLEGVFGGNLAVDCPLDILEAVP